MHVDAAIGTKNIDSRDFRGEIEQKRVARGLPATESIPVFRSIFLDKYQIFARRIYNIIFKRFPEKRTGNGMSEYCSGTNFTGSPGILANVTGVPANTRVSSPPSRDASFLCRARVKNLI